MGEGFPLWSLASMAWERRDPLRDWICLSFSLYLSLFLSVSAFFSAALSPFRVYMEIRNSDWAETFAVIFLPKISFLAAEEGHQPPYGWPTRVRGAPTGQARPLPRGHLGHRLAWIFLPEFPNIPKISSIRFNHVWIPFDMDILRNIKHATNRNSHRALDQYVSPKNSIKFAKSI